MTVRLGVIGCGAVARRLHLPAFRAAGGEIVAFSSRSAASAQAAADEWGSGKVFGDWREMLTLEDIDAVDICTPNFLHAEMAIAAARAGKDTLVEKPIATTIDEADAMISAARDAGTILMIAHNMRFAAPFVAVRNELEAGSVGDIVAVRAALGNAGPQVWAPEARWFYDRDLSGGGVLIDLGIHVADLLRSIVGDEVSEVSAMLQAEAGGVEHAAQVIMRFAKGAIGSMHVSWNARPAPDYQLTIFGTEGTLHLDSATSPVLRSISGDARVISILDPVPDLCAAFVKSVETRSTPPVTGEDGRAALAIVAAAYRSADEKRTLLVAS